MRYGAFIFTHCFNETLSFVHVGPSRCLVLEVNSFSRLDSHLLNCVFDFKCSFASRILFLLHEFNFWRVQAEFYLLDSIIIDFSRTEKSSWNFKCRSRYNICHSEPWFLLTRSGFRFFLESFYFFLQTSPGLFLVFKLIFQAIYLISLVIQLIDNVLHDFREFLPHACNFCGNQLFDLSVRKVASRAAHSTAMIFVLCVVYWRNIMNWLIRVFQHISLSSWAFRVLPYFRYAEERAAFLNAVHRQDGSQLTCPVKGRRSLIF